MGFMSKNNVGQKTQQQKFIKAAGDVGTDDDSEAFRERLKRLVKAPVPPKKDSAKGKKI